jgi:phage terminase small subunit
MKKKLTEKEEKFLDALFGEAEGNAVKAKKIAGYSKNTPTRQIVEKLAPYIEEETRKFISTTAPKAAFSMMEVLNNPTALGNKDKIAAAKDMLDRAGMKAVEKVEVSATSPLFILPAKESMEE